MTTYANNLINLARAVDSLAGIPCGAGYEADMRTALNGDLKYGTDGVVLNIRVIAPRYGYAVITTERGYDLRRAGVYVLMRDTQVAGVYHTRADADTIAAETGYLVIDVTDTVRKFD